MQAIGGYFEGIFLFRKHNLIFLYNPKMRPTQLAGDEKSGVIIILL